LLPANVRESAARPPNRRDDEANAIRCFHQTHREEIRRRRKFSECRWSVAAPFLSRTAPPPNFSRRHKFGATAFRRLRSAPNLVSASLVALLIFRALLLHAGELFLRRSAFPL